MNNNRGFTLIEVAIVVAIIGVLATIAISIYSKQMTQANNVAALSDLRAAMESQEAYYLDHKKYTEYPIDLKGYGMSEYATPGVDMVFELPDGDDQRYHIVAYHESGDKKYIVTGPGGPIDGQPK